MEDLFKQIDYTIKDEPLLKQAFTHRSYKKGLHSDNERLEFLGDAVLNLSITDQLMKRYPDYDEGQLTKIKSQLASGQTLAELALQLNLNRYLQTGNPSDSKNPRMLAGAMEALLAVIYLDAGFKQAKHTIKNLFAPRIENFLSVDYKTELQEWCQKKYKTVPIYKLKKEEGPAHRKIFYIDVVINAELVGASFDKQKKQAEQMAAKLALLKLSVV